MSTSPTLHTTPTNNTWPTARPNLMQYTHFYLVGIKGVAMTSIAMCLLDAKKKVSGSDVTASFVTQPQLDRRGLHQSHLDTTFKAHIPKDVDCVIYTSAHQAHNNPQVVAAQKKGIPVFSQAEAIASLANQKKVIAVCGVGGKSTISAMITWIMTQLNQDISYSVGVGEIPGLDTTGKWSETSEYFVIEADEYVTNPQQAQQGKAHIPRFAYLEPSVIVCTNLQFDHPDVYRDFNHTKETYISFFKQLKPNGSLIINGNDTPLQKMITTQSDILTQDNKQIITFGTKKSHDWVVHNINSTNGKTKAIVNNTIPLELQLPGKYNLLNAIAALAAVHICKVPVASAAQALTSFKSTKRRAESIGIKNGVYFYDDYAHHPKEIQAVIQAFLDWFPHQRVVFAFQPHTYSRTKELYSDFVKTLSLAPELLLTDIFSSAREKPDPSISSKKLATDIPNALYLKDNVAVSQWVTSTLNTNDVFITLGAGDIYQVHELIPF